LGAALQADGEYEVRVDDLKHQKEKRSIDHFAGLDVSVKETSVYIVDDTGKIVRAAAIRQQLGAKRKCLVHARNDATDLLHTFLSPKKPRRAR